MELYKRKINFLYHNNATMLTDVLHCHFSVSFGEEGLDSILICEVLPLTTRLHDTNRIILKP